MSDLSPSRRDFLTGRSARNVVQAAGEVLADRVTGGREEPKAGDTIRLETRAMGCPWNVIMNPGPPSQIMQASDAFEVVHQAEQMLSIFKADSELSVVNSRAAADPVSVSDELWSFLERARQFSRETNGAFDLASGSLSKIWREARQADRIPDATEIETALQCSGIQRVEFDDTLHTVRFPVPGLSFDPGAIGKGYGLDQAATFLKREGMANFLVHGGYSSVYASGDHLGQGGWPVSLKNPLFLDASYATIMLQDAAIGTSGSNVQFFRHEGKRYGHIIDPRTGWPAEGLLSVTVLAPTAEQADALSTALFVMGREAAVEWCLNHTEIAALLVPPAGPGGKLEPIILNFPPDRLFLAEHDRTGDA